MFNGILMRISGDFIVKVMECLGKHVFHDWSANVKWLLRHILAPNGGAAVFHSPLDILGLQPNAGGADREAVLLEQRPCRASSIGCKRKSKC